MHLSMTDIQRHGDPSGLLDPLREAGPVARVRRRDGLSDCWMLTRYDDVRTALTDPRLTSDPEAGAQPLGPLRGPQKKDLVASDPPDHTRLRKFATRGFTPRRIEAFRPRIQQITDDLLDAIEAKGRADLVADFAYPLPVLVICELLGIPRADRADLQAWSHYLTTPLLLDEQTLEARERSWVDICQYMRSRIDDKRAEPGDDILSILADALEDGHLSDDEAISTAVLLYISGYQSPVTLIANGMLLLLERPAEIARLRRRPEEIPTAIEEIIRYDGPVAVGPFRYTKEDVEIGGVVIPKGETVYLGYGAANRDPRRFDRPDVLDLTRSENPHLGFGHGIHRCVGPFLARLEGKIAIGTLIGRFPDLASAVTRDEISWRPGTNRAVPERLPVTFTPATRAPDSTSRSA